MSKYLAAFTPYEVKSSLIHITGNEERNLSGYIENPYFEGEKYFANLTQFLLIMEAMCDDISYPQRSNENRVFSAAAENRFEGEPAKNPYRPMDDDAAQRIRSLHITEPAERQKTLATFKLNIFFRQNSSWQGSLLWLEKNLTAQFRSVLEMVLLVDSVLNQEDI